MSLTFAEKKVTDLRARVGMRLSDQRMAVLRTGSREDLARATAACESSTTFLRELDDLLLEFARAARL